MNTHDQDNDDLHDEELKALLASLPQPAPSSALDAAILADAEKALHQPAAANDSADGVLRTLPDKKAPDYLQRWRIPLGLAAAVLLTVNLIGVDWFGSKPAQFPVVGEPVTQEVMQEVAPVIAPAAAPATEFAPLPAAPVSVPAPPAPLPPPVMREAMEQQAAMQAESSLQRQAPVQRALAMPAPVAAKSAPLPPPAKLDASVWLVKIDALLKAGEGTLAQEEWAAFRQAYPDYPVDEELRQRLESK
ncbi:hypothetical protein [Janthinobacterium sp. 78]|uniref:hypothetical protein n=1 Tax=Janthinobacterium sp. 78 TaxID=2135631 RepID=UPI000D5CEB83|nr:hypothetical protein [Janthinobacterium sp. 78]PVX38594.1 hypothetical protein C8C92_5268 [Janthinobacterium sp. 78]